ncbi:MAG: hypothetical protein AAGU27_23420 [Dehalobacterium sp.]
MLNKMKILRIAMLLLVLCLISTVMISGTFAKYTSVYAGQDTALIAKWDLDITDGSTEFSIDPDDPEELDLFSHAFDTDILDTADTEKIIAPGVSGDFVLSVKNNSDVAAKVEFAMTVGGTAVNVPIEYSLTEDFAIKYETVNALEAALNALPAFTNLEVAAASVADTQTVYWRWSYTPTFTGQDNAGDTALGVTSAAGGSRTTYILTITATATQLTPGEPEGE